MKRSKPSARARFETRVGTTHLSAEMHFEQKQKKKKRRKNQSTRRGSVSVNKCRNRLEHCRFPSLFFHAMFTQGRGILLSNLFLYQFPMFRGDLTPGKRAHNAGAVYPHGRRNRSGVQNNSNTFPTQICSRSRHSILATARSQILVRRSDTVDNICRFA